MQHRVHNRFLEALSPESRTLLLQRAVSVSLPTGTVLYEPRETPTAAYFLTAGIASTISTTQSGDTAEVGLIGHEGIVGSLHLLGPAPVPAQSMVQVDAQALRIPLPELKKQFGASEEIRNRVLEFVQNESLTTLQIAGCHRLHGTRERLSRWLLMVQDRVQSEELKLTHAFLALMLGIRRPTVTLVARSLQEEGVLELHRGCIRIQDRTKLEAMACDCYGTARELYSSLYRAPIT